MKLNLYDEKLAFEAVEANRLWYAAWLRGDTVDCAKQIARVRRVIWERHLKDVSATRGRLGSMEKFGR